MYIYSLRMQKNMSNHVEPCQTTTILLVKKPVSHSENDQMITTG